MRLTKYPQSCLLLEKDDARILLDPGVFVFESFTIDDLGPIDAVLYTHQHPDHLDRGRAEELATKGAALYGNADVRSQLPDLDVTEVRDGEALEVVGFEVTPRNLPHVELVDGSPGPPNTGFLIDDTLFHPGDGMGLAGLRVDTLAVPIVGPSISYRDAYVFVEQVGASLAVPIHYDFFIADPELFAGFVDIADVVVLGHGESTDL